MTGSETKPGIFARTAFGALLAALASACGAGSGAQVRNRASFVVDQLPGATNFEITKTDPSGQYPEEMLYNLKACMKDIASLNPVVAEPFSIDGDNGFHAEGTTDPSGCVAWQERIEVPYTQPEIYIRLKRRFTAKRAQRGMREVEFAIDPWKKNTEVIDLRYAGVEKSIAEADLSAQAQASSAGSNPTDRITVTDFSANTVGLEYRLEDDLELIQYRKYQISFHPMIERKGVNNLVTAMPLYTGQFKLRVAVILPPALAAGGSGDVSPVGGQTVAFVPGSRVLGGYETFVNAEKGGWIVATVSLPFSFEELRLVPARAQFVLQLTPADAGSNYQPAIGMAPFVPLDGYSFGAYRDYTPTIDSVLDQVVGPQGGKAPDSPDSKGAPLQILYGDTVNGGRTFRIARQRAQDTLQQFRAYYAVTDLGDSERGKAGLTQADLDALLSGAEVGPEVAVKFCPLLAADEKLAWYQTLYKASPLTQCKLNPAKFLDLVVSRHVEQLSTPVPRVDGSHFTDISFSYSVGSDASYSKGSSVTAGVGGDISAPIDKIPGAGPILGKIFGFRLSGGWNYAWTRTQTQNSHTTGMQGKTLHVEQADFTYQATTRRCLLVQAHGAADNASTAPTRYFYCSPNLTHEAISDAWYYLSENDVTAPTALRDPTDPNQRGLSKMLRGQAAFRRFQRAVTDTSQVWILSKDSRIYDPMDPLNKVVSSFNQPIPFLADGNFPGVVDEVPVKVRVPDNSAGAPGAMGWGT